MIDRFGAAAVLGRPLNVLELTRLTGVEAIVQGYEAWMRAPVWRQWMKDNPDIWRLLERARKARDDAKNLHCNFRS